MKQYRYTSENFVAQGETGDVDAHINPTDLHELRRLAGLAPLAEDNGSGPVGGNLNNVPQAQETGIVSPVGSNISHTADYRNRLLDKYQARPGDELWFMINFEPVRGMGEAAGHLEEKIQAYLAKHPEARPENQPRMPGEA